MLGRNGVGARDLTDEVTDERGKDGIVWRLQHAETDLEGLQDLYPCSEIPEPVLGLDPKDRIASKELFGLRICQQTVAGSETAQRAHLVLPTLQKGKKSLTANAVLVAHPIGGILSIPPKDTDAPVALGVIGFIDLVGVAIVCKVRHIVGRPYGLVL